jgi:hypothetical protein
MRIRVRDLPSQLKPSAREEDDDPHGQRRRHKVSKDDERQRRDKWGQQTHIITEI